MELGDWTAKMTDNLKPTQSPSDSRVKRPREFMPEPMISDLLAEPIVQSVMKADHVSARQIVSILRQVRRERSADGIYASSHP
jgi:hypothetical protein